MSENEQLKELATKVTTKINRNFILYNAAIQTEDDDRIDVLTKQNEVNEDKWKVNFHFSPIGPIQMK